MERGGEGVKGFGRWGEVLGAEGGDREGVEGGDRGQRRGGRVGHGWC